MKSKPVEDKQTLSYSVELPGIPFESRSAAERDIRMLADAVAAATEKRGLPFLLKLVRVTNSFQEDVNFFLKERAGPSGYIAARANAHALARTLWIRTHEEELGFAVVINADAVNPWNLNNPNCLITVSHELFHVMYEASRLKRLGEEEYTAGNNNAERMLDCWANLLLDEFDVDRNVNTLIRALTTKEDGHSWSLRELKEALGEDWVQGLMDSLDRAPQVVNEEVGQYLAGGTDIQHIADGLLPYVNDMMTILAHTASLYMGTDSWPRVLERIKETETSKRFFKEHLDTILGHLEDTRMESEESIQAVASALEEIFRNCGVGFKTLQGGLYITVQSPSR